MKNILILLILASSCAKMNCDTDIVGVYDTVDGEREFTETHYIYKGINNTYSIDCDNIAINFLVDLDSSTHTIVYKYKNTSKKLVLKTEGVEEAIFFKRY